MPGPRVMKFQDYDHRYPEAFDQLVRDVCTAVGREVRMVHVGSMSVHGLGGRGVIDVVFVLSLIPT